jgi:transposase-like protein
MLDGFEPSHCALGRMGIRGDFNFFGPNAIKIGSSKYLHSTVEQDHRRIKFRVSAMLGLEQRARRIANARCNRTFDIKRR